MVKISRKFWVALRDCRKPLSRTETPSKDTVAKNFREVLTKVFAKTRLSDSDFCARIVVTSDEKPRTTALLRAKIGIRESYSCESTIP